MLASLTLSVALVTLVGPSAALAARGDLPPPGPLQNLFAETGGYFIPKVCLGEQPAPPAPQCGLPEMVQIAVNVSKLLLGLLGSVTLLVFVYGGFVWLTAAGNSQRIEHGRKVFEGALVGFLLVLSSWLIIYFVAAALVGAPPGAEVKLFPEGGQGVEGPPLQVPR
jgi:hypothetical protein